MAVWPVPGSNYVCGAKYSHLDAAAAWNSARYVLQQNSYRTLASHLRSDAGSPGLKWYQYPQPAESQCFWPPPEGNL
eukprot:2664418-Rhodomonas_salina.1